MSKRVHEFFTVNIILAGILALLAAAAFAPQHSTPVLSGGTQPIYKVHTGEKKLALMCNVYWGTEYVRPYLALAQKYNAKITFFIGGIWAAENPALVKEMYLQGHEIANHGYNHKLASRESSSVIISELLKTDAILREITGVKPVLYAPPAGDFTQQTVLAAAENGYSTVMWSIDTIDWRDHDCAKIKRRARSLYTHPPHRRYRGGALRGNGAPLQPRLFLLHRLRAYCKKRTGITPRLQYSIAGSPDAPKQ